MKIAYKLPLVQLFLTLLFFLALTFIIIFFVQISELLSINANISQLHQESIYLNKEQNLLPLKQVSYVNLYRQLGDSIKNTQELFDKTEVALSTFRFASDEILYNYSLIYVKWEKVVYVNFQS
ncbi:MAG: hypothetical protein PF447_01895, partial [Spirochaetaceae bacterium]|nr:hypothetical protein [Spirochaetaceae bacterium]